MSGDKGENRPKLSAAQEGENGQEVDRGTEETLLDEAIQDDKERRAETGDDLVPGAPRRDTDPESPVRQALQENRDQVAGSGKDEV